MATDKTPKGLCPACWRDGKVCPPKGPTCSHNGFNWGDHFKLIGEALGVTYKLNPKTRIYETEEGQKA